MRMRWVPARTDVGLNESVMHYCCAVLRQPGSGVNPRARLDRRQSAMAQTRILEELSARISEFLAASPAKDLEKNLRALLSAAFAKLDLATHEQLEVQARVLLRAREKLSELEARVAELEARQKQK